MTVYLDGVLVLYNDICTRNLITSASDRMFIGNFTPVGNSYYDDFLGLIDDVRVYNTALSAAEISAIFDQIALQTLTQSIATTVYARIRQRERHLGGQCRYLAHCRWWDAIYSKR